MPIIWRYLIWNYLKITSTCVCAFIAILLTMRLDEIAHFAALGAPLSLIIFFALYQIPYILPVAIPLSCLIASLLLMQKMSSSYELTALRASGFGLRDTMAPVLLTAAFLALVNFLIISEVSTYSHLQTNWLKNEFRSVNPLLLLQNRQLVRLKGIYFETFGPSKVGEFASNALLAFPSISEERLNLLLAGRLEASPSSFKAQDTTLITTHSSQESEAFDDLFIENIKSSTSPVKDFSPILQKKAWNMQNDYLSLPLLLTRIGDQKKELQTAVHLQASSLTLKQLKASLHRSYVEIGKRIAISFAVFTLTLMGMACGIQISRRKSYKGLAIAITLTTLFLICFFTAKSMDRHLALVNSLYLAPHLIVIFTSVWLIRRITKGIEA